MELGTYDSRAERREVRRATGHPSRSQGGTGETVLVVNKGGYARSDAPGRRPEDAARPWTSDVTSTKSAWGITVEWLSEGSGDVTPFHDL